MSRLPPVMLAVTLGLVTQSAAASPPATELPRVAPRVEERLGARLPLGERFTTSRGERVALGEVLGNGRPGLLVLSYSHCAAMCSLVLRGVSELLRDYRPEPNERFGVTTLSIDPKETPHEAARVQARVLERAGYPGALERWTFLVGERSGIDAVANELGFRYVWDERTEQYAHPAVLFVISPRGEVVRTFEGVRFEPAEVRAALFGRAAPPASGRAATALSCFRFDVLERRFGGAITRAFQLGALLVLVALSSLVIGLAYRERRTAREPGASP